MIAQPVHLWETDGTTTLNPTRYNPNMQNLRDATFEEVLLLSHREPAWFGPNRVQTTRCTRHHTGVWFPGYGLIHQTTVRTVMAITGYRWFLPTPDPVPLTHEEAALLIVKSQMGDETPKLEWRPLNQADWIPFQTDDIGSGVSENQWQLAATPITYDTPARDFGAEMVTGEVRIKARGDVCFSDLARHIESFCGPETPKVQVLEIIAHDSDATRGGPYDPTSH